MVLGLGSSRVVGKKTVMRYKELGAQKFANCVTCYVGCPAITVCLELGGLLEYGIFITKTGKVPGKSEWIDHPVKCWSICNL